MCWRNKIVGKDFYEHKFFHDSCVNDFLICINYVPFVSDNQLHVLQHSQLESTNRTGKQPGLVLHDSIWSLYLWWTASGVKRVGDDCPLSLSPEQIISEKTPSVFCANIFFSLTFNILALPLPLRFFSIHQRQLIPSVTP